MKNDMDGKILTDGTIKTTTGEFNAVDHQAAEAFMKLLAQLTGGETHRDRRGDRPETHTHHDTGVTHSH